MDWVYNDGGRVAAGFKGETGDCVTRAISIATGDDYHQVYSDLKMEAENERPRNGRKKSTIRNGVHKPTYRRYLKKRGFDFVPTMGIGTGCQVHLRAKELPPGRIIAKLSRHVVAVVDGVIHDTYNPDRDGMRCVYGYWKVKN